MVLSKIRLPCNRSGLSAVAEGGEFFKHAPAKKKKATRNEESVEEYSN